MFHILQLVAEKVSLETYSSVFLHLFHLQQTLECCFFETTRFFEDHSCPAFLHDNHL